MFYLDEQARSAHTNDNLQDICNTVLCQSDSKPGGVFRVGPALEGTRCGEGRWCNDGKCVTAQFHQGGGGSHTSSAGSTGKKGPYFGPWSDGTCESECLLGSKGYKWVCTWKKLFDAHQIFSYLWFQFHKTIFFVFPKPDLMMKLAIIVNKFFYFLLMFTVCTKFSSKISAIEQFFRKEVNQVFLHDYIELQ